MKKTKVFSGLAIAFIAISLVSYAVGYQQGFKLGAKSGFEQALTVIQTQTGLELSFREISDGVYEVHIFNLNKGSLEFKGVLELHMTVEHWRGDELLSMTYHAMSLTNFGKNWIADKLVGGPSNWDENATYISCSNDSSTFSAAWTVLPNEITTDGLERAANDSYTDTGVGTWNHSKTFTATGTNSTKLYGYHLTSSGNDLIAAEQQGVGSQKNLVASDTLKITIQGTIS